MTYMDNKRYQLISYTLSYIYAVLNTYAFILQNVISFYLYISKA